MQPLDNTECPPQIGGLEDLLSPTACLDGYEGSAAGDGAGGSASPLAIPHASEAYARILERARGEAGADNVARCEAALFALMYGPSLAPPPSPFTQQGDGKGAPSPAPAVGPHGRGGHGPLHYGRHHGHGHRHESGLEEGAAIMQLGRRSLSLRGSSSQVSMQFVTYPGGRFAINLVVPWHLKVRIGQHILVFCMMMGNPGAVKLLRLEYLVRH